jgi:hypothetical protein
MKVTSNAHQTAIVTSASCGNRPGRNPGTARTRLPVAANSRTISKSTELKACEHMVLVDGDIR